MADYRKGLQKMKKTLLFLFLISSPAYAAELFIPVKAKLVQCGTIENAALLCNEDENSPCCAFMDRFEPSSGDDRPDYDLEHSTTYEIRNGGWYLQTENYE